jgi:hypothetical protein
MSKQQTPIQKAIQDFKNRASNLRESITLNPSQPKKVSEATEQRAIAFERAAEILENFIPEEKKFAEEAYVEGVTKPPNDNSYDKFTDFYKQYEDE